MEAFDYHKLNEERKNKIREIPVEILGQQMNQDYPAGPEELEELLTFLPEEQRAKAIQGFIGAMLVT